MSASSQPAASSNAAAAVYTGLTRDGTFLIEDGRITGAVEKLR